MKKNNSTSNNSVNHEDNRQNEIIRIQKKHNNFVMLDKGFIEDERLSWKAKGILSYLLSKPDQWKVIIGDIVKHSKDGERAVYSGLNELKQYGYYCKYPVREGQRIVRWESVVYECPQNYQEEVKTRKKQGKTEKHNDKPMEKSASSLLCGFVDVENEDVAFVDVENSDHSNINISNQLTLSNNISINQQNEMENTIDNDLIDTHKTESSNTQSTMEHNSDGLLDILQGDNIPQVIANNICLDELISEFSDKQDKINELYQIICEVLTANNSPTIRISKQNTPIITVKLAFCSLEKRHILYVLDCIEKNQSKITRNVKGYIITSLFHSVKTIDYYKSYSKSAFKDNPQPKSDSDEIFEKMVRHSMKF